jgi:transporter family-2 protein
MFFALAFANGLLAVWARVVNARLSDHVGSLRGSLVNHAVGLLLAAVLVMLGLGGGAVRLGGIAPVYLSGGVLGVLVVAISNYAVRHAGAALFAVLVLAFQLIGSALIDHYGWLGQSPIALSWPRLAGLALLIVGGILVVTDGHAIRAASAGPDGGPSPDDA